MRLNLELATSKRKDIEVLESIGDILLAKTLIVGKSNDCGFSDRALVLLELLLMEGLDNASQEGYIGGCW